MPVPPVLEGLSPLADQFDAVVCDLWGVAHDGIRALPDAVECLKALRDQGKLVVFLSNAPRPPDSVAFQIEKLGVPNDAFDGIVTSGGLARSYVDSEFSGGAFFHLGPSRDKDTVAGLSLRAVSSPKDADIVICTGLTEASEDDVERHQDLLRLIADCQIPLVCANPDRVVHVGRREVICSGELAHRLETMGGVVVWFGKPFANAYAAAEDMLAQLSNRQISKSRILAIGDSMETDIKGAKAAGLQCLLIADGIHHAELRPRANSSSQLDDKAALERFLEPFEFFPDAIMASLCH